MKKSTVICGVLLLTFVVNMAEAKESLHEISWPHAVYSGIKQRDEKLLEANDKNVLNEFSMAITARLKALQQKNELPFQLKETDNSFEEDKSADGSVTIVPLLLDDHAYVSKYSINNQEFSTAVLMCQMDILFCYYPGSGSSLRCLYNIPLIGHKNLGPFEGGVISKDILKREYIDGVKQLIGQELNFKNKNILKDLELHKVTPDTYQVTDVTLTSPSANKFYGEIYPKIKNEDGLPLVKALIASSYTSSFAAKHPELTVLPSRAVGNWEENAAKGTFQLSLGDSGKYITSEEANNKISLDLFKLAGFDVPLKYKTVNVYTVKGIVAGLKDTGNGKESLFTITKQFPVTSDVSNQARYPYVSLFAEVISGAAKELGGK